MRPSLRSASGELPASVIPHSSGARCESRASHASTGRNSGATHTGRAAPMLRRNSTSKVRFCGPEEVELPVEFVDEAQHKLSRTQAAFVVAKYEVAKLHQRSDGRKSDGQARQPKDRKHANELPAAEASESSLQSAPLKHRGLLLSGSGRGENPNSFDLASVQHSLALIRSAKASSQRPSSLYRSRSHPQVLKQGLQHGMQEGVQHALPDRLQTVLATNWLPTAAARATPKAGPRPPGTEDRSQSLAELKERLLNSAEKRSVLLDQVGDADEATLHEFCQSCGSHIAAVVALAIFVAKVEKNTQSVVEPGYRVTDATALAHISRTLNLSSSALCSVEFRDNGSRAAAEQASSVVRPVRCGCFGRVSRASD